jgi:cysteinyl-tRNA synthetase
MQIYNVLEREKREFVPLVPGKVTMYVCGPTVYGDSHLGHARTYVSFDLIQRWLRYAGNDVLYVQNITDVGHMLDNGEDRILRRAAQMATAPMKVVELYTRGYFADMDELGVQRPDISPRASAHIPEQVEMIERLIAKGHAYVAEDGVYFDVASWEEYGKLSNRRLNEQERAENRVLRGKGKRSSQDFALWIIAPEQHMLQWNSPWGRGYPGWHIECSAMSGKYLGPTFDIHGGGIDNIFPHNECEIAQSEAANGAPFARYWMLTGTLTVDGQKMSKSVGNVINIRDVLQKYRGEVIRAFVFQKHYASPVDFSDEALTAAQKGWERVVGAVRLTREKLRGAPDGDDGSNFGVVLESTRKEFAEAMNDDFNAPIAFAALQNLTTEVNKLLNSDTTVGKNTLIAIDSLYSDLGGTVMGIIPADLGAGASGADAERQDGLIRLLIELRQEARAEKQFKRSDMIRDRLKSLGVVLEDRPDGTIYKAE